jgi:flavin-dependent dehydrogenase
MHYFIYESPFSRWFKNPCINRKTACAENIWSPLEEPFKDNVLFVGDAAWTQEAEATGALMSGHKAASAVILALKDGKIKREGVLPYINWWKEAFPGSHDYRHYLRGFALSNLLTEEDANYLYSLIEEPLPYNLNPFKLSGNMNKALEKVMPKIKKERPEIINKFQSIMNVPLDAMLASRIRGCFPNR